MNRRIVTVVSVLVCTSAVGAAFLHASRRASLRPGTHVLAGQPAVSGEAAPASQSATLSRAGWEPGAEYVHNLEYRVSIGPDKSAENAAQRLGFRVKGQWRSTVSEVRGDTLRVRIELGNASVEAPNAGSDAASQAGAALTTRSLAQPFFVDYDQHGRALGAHVQRGLDSLALGLLRELVSASQFSTPEQPAARWTALEIDPAGQYEAEYSTAGNRQFTRQKTRYVRVTGPHGLVAARATAPTIRASAAHFTLDDTGRVTNLQSHLDVVTPQPVAGGGEAFEAESDLTLAFVSRGKSSQALPLSVAGLEATTLTPNEHDFAAAAQNNDQSLVGGSTVTSLLHDLGGLASDDAQGASSVQARISALFRLDPHAIPLAMARLDRSNAPVILGALGSVATPEAQKALADVTRDEHRDPSERQAAVDSMFNVEHPTHDMSEALKSLLNSKDPELKNNGSLMLGVTARKLASDDPDEANALSGRLASDLGSATDPNERLRLLGSLGNTGSSQGLAEISKALASDDPGIRAAAASALRFVQGAEVDALLSKVIVSDPSSGVRSAALAAAGYRAYEPLATALETVAKKEPDAVLRTQLVATLANMAAQSSEALPLLDWMVQNDGDKDVRARAKQALDQVTALAQN